MRFNAEMLSDKQFFLLELKIWSYTGTIRVIKNFCCIKSFDASQMIL